MKWVKDLLQIKTLLTFYENIERSFSFKCRSVYVKRKRHFHGIKAESSVLLFKT